MIQKKSLLVLAFFLALGCDKSQPSKPTDNYDYVQVGEITDKNVDEISGLAISRMNPDVLWVINDSGDKENIYALSHSGEMIAGIKVDGAENDDWEDLALFSYQGVDHLLIADTGGNTSNRKTFDLYIVREPNVFETPKSVNVQWRIRFQYEDEPRDCEAVAVDAHLEKIYLLSKRSVPAVLYEVPLRPGGDSIVTAKRLGEVRSIPQPTSSEIKKRYDEYHAQPTGLDATPGGRKITVLTYRRLFIYERAENESWIDALNKTPLQIEYPPLEQAEAICFYTDEQAVLVTSEQLPAPILKIEPKANH